jgi:hypothetical protein
MLGLAESYKLTGSDIKNYVDRRMVNENPDLLKLSEDDLSEKREVIINDVLYFLTLIMPEEFIQANDYNLYKYLDKVKVVSKSSPDAIVATLGSSNVFISTPDNKIRPITDADVAALKNGDQVKILPTAIDIAWTKRDLDRLTGGAKKSKSKRTSKKTSKKSKKGSKKGSKKSSKKMAGGAKRRNSKKTSKKSSKTKSRKSRK